MTDRYEFWMYLSATITTLIGGIVVAALWDLPTSANVAIGGVLALVGMLIGGSYGIRREGRQ